MENKPILEVRGLAYAYDEAHPVLTDINFALHPGEVFAILGANGAGKSTLLNCISDMLTPTRGEVLLQGRRVSDYPVNDLAKILGYVPQLSTPTFAYTVRDYVVMGRAPYMGLLNVPGRAEYDKADQALARMGISHLVDQLYNGISGGERQQVQIARVLVQESRVVLLDEPTNHLDYGNQLKIVKIIAQLAREGLAVLLTTHMPDHAILLDGTVGLMDGQGAMTVGPAREIMTEERLRDLYHTDLHLVYIDQLQRTACVAGRL